MQSKSFPRKLLSPRTVFIAAPSLIGVTAIAAAMTSLTTGRPFSPTATTSNQVSDTSPAPQPARPSSPPVIAAQPLDPIAPKSSDSKHSPASPKVVTATPTQPSRNSSSPQPPPKSRPQSPQPAQQPSTSAQPAPSQSALTVKSFDPSTVDDVPQVPIRVAIVRDAQHFTVATSDVGIITDSRGQILGQTSAQGAIGVVAQANGLKVGSIQSQSSLWIRPKTENGLVFVNGRWYRGLVQLIPHQGNVLAVNHVEMQPYLYSVVGAEMYHSWPAEALKAQAIAARSYALVHIVRPASPHFDLGSTQRWQAYKGVGSEANSTLSAVDATRGIVISHDGGVVESLYASSADLVREAHRGFGMSQYGAKDLANQNLNYRQILSRFYPGTDLSLLQTQ